MGKMADSRGKGVNFVRQDLRLETPPGIFDLILYLNLVFTYFEDDLQRQILRCLAWMEP